MLGGGVPTHLPTPWKGLLIVFTLYAHPGRLPDLVRLCEALDLVPAALDPVSETVTLPPGEEPGPLLTHAALAVTA